MSSKRNWPQVLLVEGNDDRHVVWALLEKYKVPQTFEIIDCGGINSLLEQLPVRFKQSGIKTIGIVIDADMSLSSRWQQLCDLLSTEGITLPLNPGGAGTIVSGRIKFGVWIMPNNQLNGVLEDFIAFLVPHKDQLLPISAAILKDIEQKKLNKYISAHSSKALIHTWLAWQEDPGTPMGLAITKRYLTTDIAVCNTFLDWIKALFS